MKILIIVLGLLPGTSLYSHAQFYGDQYQGKTITYLLRDPWRPNPSERYITAIVYNSNNKLNQKTNPHKIMDETARGPIKFVDYLAIPRSFEEAFTPEELKELYIQEKSIGGLINIGAIINPDGKAEEVFFYIRREAKINVLQLEKLELALKRNIYVSFNHQAVKNAGGGYEQMPFNVNFERISVGRY